LQVLAPHPQLFNAIIEGIPFPFQLKTTESPVPDEDFTADILAEGNVITFPQGTVTEDGITLSNTLRIIVRNNIVGSETDGGHRQSIRAGAITGPPPNGAQRQFPGNCTLNSSRDCLSDFDCNIPDIDSVSQGTCTLPPTQPVFWTSLNSVIENNTIFGPFNQGIATTGENFTIQGNNIIGPIRPGGAGISLGGKGPLETAVVVRNTMSGVSTVFSLGKVFSGISASFFGVKINFNDFTGYTTAIRTSNDYDLPSELSVDGKGNYWDLDNCTLGGFDETKVVPLNPSVVDSNPYGEEVGVIVTDSRPCDMDSKSCNGNPAIGCDTDANCIAYTYRADPPPPLTCPEQGF
jgi:hypothetical protein